MTTTIGTFEYRGCPSSTYNARELVLEKLRKIESADIGFSYTFGVHIRDTGDKADAPQVVAIGESQRSAKFTFRV